MLHIENLRLQRSAAFCLSLANWQLPTGQHALLQGPSGCGKSSLLAVLAGLLKPSEGRVVLDGVDLVALDADALRRWRARHAGIVFQSLHLLPVLSVRENAELAQSLAERIDARHLDAVIDALGLRGVQHFRPAQLSGGQQQRAAVLRAIAHKPRWLFADEPTSALDTRHAFNTLQVLKTAAELTSAQLIVASHDTRIETHFSQILAWPEQQAGEPSVRLHQASSDQEQAQAWAAVASDSGESQRVQGGAQA